MATGASVSGAAREVPLDDGWQPDYVTEGVVYAKHILANVKDPKIAVLMQNDDYGRDYFNGFKKGLGKDADKIVQVVTYEVADPSVDSQMIALKNSGANTFFNITTPKFAAQAIKKAHELGWKPAHYLNSVSASIGAVIKPAGFDASQGIITARYTKDATDPVYQKDADMVAWGAFMDKYYPQGDKTSTFTVYGAVSSTVLEVFKRAGDNLTRDNIMKQAASLKGLEGPLLAKLAVLPLQSLDPLALVNGRAGPLALVALGLPNPVRQGLRCAADLGRDRGDRGPLRCVLRAVLQRHPHRALTHLGREPRGRFVKALFGIDVAG